MIHIIMIYTFLSALAYLVAERGTHAPNVFQRMAQKLTRLNKFICKAFVVMAYWSAIVLHELSQAMKSGLDDIIPYLKNKKDESI